jgi:hypothetical protein
MYVLCREVQKFVSACETLQWMLAHGNHLSSDERGVVAYSARDLLKHLGQDSEQNPHI